MRFLKWCNILSIDVALGSMAMSAMIAKSFHVQMSITWWYLLPTAVWWIYTADHLSDAQKASNFFLSERHLFHRTHFKKLSFVLTIVGSTGLTTAIFYLDKELLLFGCIVCVVSVIYLVYSFLCKQYVVPKEIVVAVVYTTGVGYGPIILKNFELNPIQAALLVSVFLTAWCNLLIFSFIDTDEDKKSGFSSIVNTIGLKKTARLCHIVFLLNFTILLFIAVSGFDMLVFSVTLAAINMVLLFIYIKKEKFIINNHYRLIGDMVLILPVVPTIFC